MAGPLDGYRILDLTMMITGLLTTIVLGNRGAEVIKVEPPGLGDISDTWMGPETRCRPGSPSETELNAPSC